jgi:ABC-2 type transport system permease protein
MLGVVLIAKEERDHAADFLYAKPVLREQVVTAKLLAGLVNLLILNAVTFVTSIISIGSYNEGDMLVDRVLMLMVALLILQVLFLCLGAALGALLKTAKLATSAATAIILGTFFLSAAIDIDHRIQSLHFLTPFKYFDANDLLLGGKLPVWTSLLTLVISAIALVVAYIAFKRRDLAV